VTAPAGSMSQQAYKGWLVVSPTTVSISTHPQNHPIPTTTPRDSREAVCCETRAVALDGGRLFHLIFSI